MNRGRTQHPDEESLLRYADSELPSRDAGHVRAHMEACWRCRAAVEDIQRTITDYARYHEAFVTAPEPPQPWGGFEVQLERLIAERQNSWGKRARRILRGIIPHRHVWASAVAATLVLAVVFFELNRPPSVSAAELLQKASAREVNLVGPTRLLVKTRTHTFARAGIVPANGHLGAGDVPSDIRAMFIEADYSWENPLSAASFAAWRAGLSDKRDEVTMIRDGEDRGLAFYRIQTNTSSSPLREAALTLRANNYAAVRGIFRFGGSEWVEITAEPDEPTRSIRSEPATVPSGQSTRHVPQGSPRSRRTINEPAQELRVLAALRRVGADLGEQIEISRDNDRRLVVTATAVTTERQDSLRASLADVPDTTLRFHEPTAGLGDEDDSFVSDEPLSPTDDPLDRDLQLRLKSTLEAGVSFESFANQVLETSAAALARAHAIRKLANRFSRDVEARLENDDRAILLQLREDHVHALARHTRELEHLVRPVLVGLGAPAEQIAPLAASQAWQGATQDLFAAAQRLDRLLTTLLTGAGAGSPENVINEASRAMTRLDTEIALYQSMTENMQREER